MRSASGLGPPKFALAIAKGTWGKFSPFSFMRKATVNIARKIISNYMKSKMNCENEAERMCLLEYLYQIFLREGTTEFALFL